MYGNLAMVNYPYETSFSAPLPSDPVLQFCSYLNGALDDAKFLFHIEEYDPNFPFMALRTKPTTPGQNMQNLEESNVSNVHIEDLNAVIQQVGNANCYQIDQCFDWELTF